MKITVIGVSGSGALATAFCGGARTAGHHARFVDAGRLVAGSRPLVLARRMGVERPLARPLLQLLRRRVVATEPDVVLVVKGRFLSRRWIEQLRRTLDRPVLNYYPDHPLWPGHDEPEILEALAAYDEVLVWADHVRRELVSAGVRRVRVVPFGYDPSVYRPAATSVEFAWDVTLVGQQYPRRLEYATALADYRLLVSGRGWKTAAKGTPLEGRTSERTYPGESVCELYWRSAVALNVVAEWNLLSHNMRTFEIPASGTPMIATRTPDHVALFGDGGAVLVDSAEEARAATQDLLGDREARDAIAAEGRRRVEGHTYAARVAAILEPWLPIS